MSVGSSFGGSSSPQGIDLFSATRSEPESRFNEVSSEEFFNLVLTELSNQDPTEPQDTQALLEQIGLIRSIESEQAVVSSLEELTEQSSFASAAGLIGAEVTGLTEGGRFVDDLVLSVSSTRDGTVVNLLGGERVRFENITEVRAPLGLLGEPVETLGGSGGGNP